MATKAVKQMMFATQRGASLIELLLATLIASGLLVSSSRLFIKTQQQSYQLLQDVQLIEDLYRTLYMLKTEVRRAGFNATLGHSLTLTGASKVIESGSDWVDVISLIDDEGKWYKTRYQKDASDPTLDVCTQSVFTHLLKPGIGPCSGNFFSLLDNNAVQLSEFSISQAMLAGGNTSLLSIDMTLSHANSAKQLSQFTLIKQRNWQ